MKQSAPWPSIIVLTYLRKSNIKYFYLNIKQSKFYLSKLPPDSLLDPLNLMAVKTLYAN